MALTDVAKQAVEALKSGQSVREVVDGGGAPDEVEYAGSSRPVEDDDETVAVRAEHDSALDSLFGGSDADESSQDTDEKDAQSETVDSEESTTDEETEPSDENVEYVRVTDAEGRRRRVKIDYTDKDSIRKAYRQAAGFRKFQAERDQLREELDTYRSTVSEKVESYDSLDAAYRERGVEGVIDLLGGDSAEDMKRELAQQYLDYQNASAEERALIDERRERERVARTASKRDKELEELREQMEKQREDTELRQIQSRVNPAFDRYRFAGKLGDADAEHTLDEMLWNTALRRLEPLEERYGADIPSHLVEREMRSAAVRIRKLIGKQSEKQVKRTVEKKKQEATEQVQTQVSRGRNISNTESEARDLIKNGNLSAVLTNWGKYGKIFSGR